MRFGLSLQFDPTEAYQPASLQLIREALKMRTPSKNLQAVSRAQSEGKYAEGGGKSCCSHIRILQVVFRRDIIDMAGTIRGHLFGWDNDRRVLE